MTPRRPLPPPRGADETRAAALGARFAHEQLEQAADAAAPAAQPEPARSTSRTPAGMTRVTYYLPRSTVAELAAGVEQIRAATGEMVSKHAAMAALVAAGVEQVDAVAARLRDELLTHLGQGSAS